MHAPLYLGCWRGGRSVGLERVRTVRGQGRAGPDLPGAGLILHNVQYTMQWTPPSSRLASRVMSAVTLHGQNSETDRFTWIPTRPLAPSPQRPTCPVSMQLYLLPPERVRKSASDLIVGKFPFGTAQVQKKTLAA